MEGSKSHALRGYVTMEVFTCLRNPIGVEEGLRGSHIKDTMRRLEEGALSGTKGGGGQY